MTRGEDEMKEQKKRDLRSIFVKGFRHFKCDRCGIVYLKKCDPAKKELTYMDTDVNLCQECHRSFNSWMKEGVEKNV